MHPPKKTIPLKAEIVGSKNAVLARVTPKGPRLDLRPWFDILFVSDPDKGSSEPGMVGGLYMGGAATDTTLGLLEVLHVGPAVGGIEKGDRILVVKSTVHPIVYDGNYYWWTRAADIKAWEPSASRKATESL